MSIEPVSSSNPTRSTRNDTIIEATYSIRACPKGCARSAGLAEMRKDTSEIICEPASERLLKASAVIEIAPASVPTVSLPAKSSRLTMTPTTLAMVP